MTNDQVSAKVTALSNNAWSIANTLWTAFSKSDVSKIIFALYGFAAARLFAGK